METATILRIWELSDQLQQEHGIELKFDTPRKQLNYSKEHDTYGEWSARKNNLSWKEEMKDEITAAKSVSDSREDLLFNWQMGRDLVVRKAEDTWGAGIVEQVSLDLQNEFPETKGFSARNQRFLMKTLGI